jgi:hypothetical protein
VRDLSKFIVEYAIYTNQRLVKPNRFNRKVTFPTIWGAFGFWKRKALDRNGVASISHDGVTISGATIKQGIRQEWDLEAYFNSVFGLTPGRK